MKIFLAACTLLFSTLLSAAMPLDKLVVFGDSLSDNGNLYEYMKHQLPVSPPYFEGRFSDGPVWVERLMSSYYPTTMNEHLLDYAFGGAGIMEDDDGESGFFTLHSEMDSYFISHQDKADEHSLYVVWIGSNNYLALPEGDEIEKTLKNVDAGIQHGLQRLVDKGAKHIMVINLPDLGRIPLAREFDAVEVLSYLSKQHNDILQKRVNDLQHVHPEVQWIYFDVDVLLHDIMNDPESLGYTNITDTCYEEAAERPSANTVLRMVSTVKPSFKNGACNGYLFFDPVHPSGPTHVIMAERIRKLFEERGVVFQ